MNRTVFFFCELTSIFFFQQLNLGSVPVDCQSRDVNHFHYLNFIGWYIYVIVYECLKLNLLQEYYFIVVKMRGKLVFFVTEQYESEMLNHGIPFPVPMAVSSHSSSLEH